MPFWVIPLVWKWIPYCTTWSCFFLIGVTSLLNFSYLPPLCPLRKLTGYGIHGKLRPTENAVYWWLARWLSDISELKSEQFHFNFFAIFFHQIKQRWVGLHFWVMLYMVVSFQNDKQPVSCNKIIIPKLSQLFIFDMLLKLTPHTKPTLSLPCITLFRYIFLIFWITDKLLF